MVYNNIPTFSALTLWITSRHTATSFNTSDRGFPLHFPALILFCLLHWATLSLLSTTCWVSSSATKKNAYIYITSFFHKNIDVAITHARAVDKPRRPVFEDSSRATSWVCASASKDGSSWVEEQQSFADLTLAQTQIPAVQFCYGEHAKTREQVAVEMWGSALQKPSSTTRVWWLPERNFLGTDECSLLGFFYFSSGEKDRLLSPNINNYIFKSHTVGIMYSNNWAFRVFLPKRNKEKTKKHFVPAYWTNRFSNRKNFLTAIKDGL